MPNIKDIVTEQLSILYPDIEPAFKEDILQLLKVRKSSYIKKIDVFTEPYKLYDDFKNYAINYFTSLQGFNKITEADIGSIINYFKEYGYYTIFLYSTEEEGKEFYNKYQAHYKKLTETIADHPNKCLAVIDNTEEHEAENKALLNYIEDTLKDLEKEASECPSYIDLIKKAVTLERALNERDNTPKFISMLNGTATNRLTNISTLSNPPKLDAYTKTATIEQGTLKVFIDSYSELTGGLRTSTHKLLDACTLALTQQNNYRDKNGTLNPCVTIPLERFMELCGIPLTKPSKDKTRRKVKEDLETLYHISLEWTETSGNKTRDFAKMRLCDKVALVRGNIVFSFSPDMARYLTNAYLMQYPIELLKVDERNPNAYPVGRKLLLHNSIDNNKRKGTANILSVKSILEVCPDIPTYEQVLATGRQLEQRIRTPFEIALNSHSSFIRWEYCNSKGVPLTEEQLQATDYSTFINLYIKFDVLGVPDQTARLEARAEEAKARTTSKKRTSSKKKAEITA